jgi:predicted Zn-dependent protease
MLAASGYAADGVRNLMATLDAMNKPSPPAWLSTHPDTSDRVQYLETYILENGLNRYSFEGIDRHTRMRQRALDLINDYRQSADYRRRRDRRR